MNVKNAKYLSRFNALIFSFERNHTVIGTNGTNRLQLVA